MTVTRRSIVLAFALAAGGAIVHAAPVPSVEKQVEAGIMCICPDNCGKVLINCFCQYSGATREKIAGMIARGMNADQVMAVFVAEQGRVVLAAPTTKGFDLAAWVLPFAAIAVAVPTVALVIRRLGSRGRRTPDSPREPTGSSPENAARDAALEARLDRELEDLES